MQTITTGLIKKVLSYIIVFIFCSCNTQPDNKQTAMPGKNEEKIIVASNGKLVAKMHITANILDGTCEWYDVTGKLLVYGFFDNGIPFSGTFLNWSLFSNQILKDKPYDPSTYCKDWITLFEASYDSEMPDYKRLIEVYVKGEKF